MVRIYFELGYSSSSAAVLRLPYTEKVEVVIVVTVIVVSLLGCRGFQCRHQRLSLVVFGGLSLDAICTSIPT